jgi:hypothetical protein
LKNSKLPSYCGKLKYFDEIFRVDKGRYMQFIGYITKIKKEYFKKTFEILTLGITRHVKKWSHMIMINSEKIAQLIGYSKIRIEKITKKYSRNTKLFNRPLCFFASETDLKNFLIA